MVTLMQEIPAHGPIRRCTAKCYNAKKPKCRCICGGKNHGVGQNQGIANTIAHFRHMGFEIPENLYQQYLFKEGGDK